MTQDMIGLHVTEEKEEGLQTLLKALFFSYSGIRHLHTHKQLPRIIQLGCFQVCFPEGQAAKHLQLPPSSHVTQNVPDSTHKEYTQIPGLPSETDGTHSET